MNDKFLLLGLANGGLFLARQIRKQWPKSIIYGIGNPNTDVGRYSKAINRFFPATNADEAYDAILKIHIELGEEIKAFICSNPMLEWLVGKYPDVFDLLDFENDYRFYQLFADKNKTEELCRKLNVKIPKSYSLSCEIDVTNIAFPIVVKPVEKSSVAGVGKCSYIDSSEELSRFLEKTDRLNIGREQIVCQQCVSGDNRYEYGYGGYFVNGEPVVDIYFHQFRQLPQGLCCYVREMTTVELRQKVKDLVHPILSEVKANGFVEFDIKQDEKSGDLFLLDINPRPWKSSDMLEVKLNGSTVFAPSVSNYKVVWRQPFLELRSYKNKRNPAYGVCKTLTRDQNWKNKITIFDAHDMKPYLMQIKNDIRKLLKVL